MKLLGRKKDNASSDDAGSGTEPVPAPAAGQSKEAQTAPKGRPTPKRSEASRRRGPVAPAPQTSAEARKRRKEMRTKLTREERKAERVQRRARTAENRARMMAGEEAYLLPRDQGAVRRFVRNVVDSRRNLLGLFMPLGMGLVMVMLAVPSLTVQRMLSPAMLVLLAVMVVDGFFVARRVNRLVDEKFPDNTESGWKLGLYAASRASQLRRMRAPRPQVNRGDKVT